MATTGETPNGVLPFPAGGVDASGRVGGVVVDTSVDCSSCPVAGVDSSTGVAVASMVGAGVGVVLDSGAGRTSMRPASAPSTERR